jgi:hypothetical protein
VGTRVDGPRVRMVLPTAESTHEDFEDLGGRPRGRTLDHRV